MIYEQNIFSITLLFVSCDYDNNIFIKANKTIGRTNTSYKRKTVPWWNEECKDAIQIILKKI